MSAATRFDRFERDPASGKWRTGAILEWEIGRLGSGWLLMIPPGFVFDSSVPRCLHWWRSPDYRPWLLAAAVHDRLLAEGHDRHFAAAEWYRAARAKEPHSVSVVIAYVGVALWAFVQIGGSR